MTSEPLTLPESRMAWSVHEGDAIDLLERLPANSIDAFVDDPPAGISFMGRAWDDKRAYEPSTERGREILNGLDLLGLPRWQSGFVAFMAEVAAEKLRAAKPGAHSLSWALPRTTDLTVLALRLAGWEIRDSIVHLFGGGFPKSHSVSKALDKQQGEARPKDKIVGTDKMGQWRDRQGGGSHHHRALMDAGVMKVAVANDEPISDLAKQWDGWGTALSPAHENWILARKPMGQTVAANVTEWGTGGINIDGTRTGTTKDVPASPPRDRINQPSKGDERSRTADTSGFDPNVGRWPKNALFSCPLACTSDLHVPWCPEDELDRQGGTLTSGTGAVRRATASGHQGEVYGATSQAEGTPQACHADSGGASRYFPRFHNHATGCPVGELDRQSGHQVSGTAIKRNGVRNDNPVAFASSLPTGTPDQGHGDSGGASRFFPRFGYYPKASDRTVPGHPGLTNKHPTHKNPDLMRWLVRLITPPGGLVLDWCCGSGTTGVAAMAEGCRFLGFERDPDHVVVARARIGAPVQVGLF